MFTHPFIYAQSSDATGAYSPYSFYGVGDLSKPGFAYNKAMGGIGYGLRTNRVINYINPAAINMQDSSSFMFDFGGELRNYYISSATQHTAANSFNIDHLAFSFPVWRKMAVAVGVMPYSQVGYDITRNETNNNVVVETSSTQYSYIGEGGLNQLVLSYAAAISPRLSVGGHAHFIFGSIDRYYNIHFVSSAMSPIYSSSSIKANGTAFTLGAQYTQPLGDKQMVIGAAYQFRNNMKVDEIDYSYVSSALGTDTVRYDVQPDARLLVPATLGIGVSLSKTNKWQAGIDYVYQDWQDATFNATSSKDFTAKPSHAIRGGLEYTPNMYDIRYFMKRVSYRAGLFYEKTYMQFGNSRIKNYGITLGAGIPLGIYNNAVNVAAEIGQRGTTDNGLLREFYWNVSVSISLYDIWFRKFRYE